MKMSMSYKPVVQTQVLTPASFQVSLLSLLMATTELVLVLDLFSFSIFFSILLGYSWDLQCCAMSLVF